jgi:DNA-binding winged helix-turn-helix (wHTH) protein
MVVINESEIEFSKKIKEVKFGNWNLSPKHQTISDGKIQRELEPLIYSLLIYFIQNSDKIITRQELVNDVWKQTYVDDNAINRAMSELRKSLKSELQRGQVIKTHYRKGYSFLLDLDVLYNDIPQKKVEPLDIELTQKYIKVNSKYNKIILLTLVMIFSIFLVSFFYNDLPNKSANTFDSTSNKFKLVENILSWEKGTTVFPKASVDKKLIAYAFKNNEDNNFNLHIKDLSTSKQYVIAENNDNIFPIGWSKNNILFYQLEAKNKCEVWQVNLSMDIKTRPHKKILTCKSNQLMSATSFDQGKKLIYTKYNYRNTPHLSAIVAKDLTSGSEFQVTSPNNADRGDYFVKVSNNESKIAFLRAQKTGTQIFIANVDGSDQSKEVEIQYDINSISWSLNDNEIMWLNSKENKIITYNLVNKKTSETLIGTDYSLKYAEVIAKNRVLLVTNFRDLNISKIDLNTSKEGSFLSDYSNTNLQESLIAPLNLSSGSIYLTGIKSKSLWHYEDGIRKKLIDLNYNKINSIVISPDDTKLLIQEEKQLIIYNLKDLSIEREVELDGIIESATWPLESKILLAYTDKLKVTPWFYDLDNDKLIKLLDDKVDIVRLFSEENLLFFNDKSELIKANINNGTREVILSLPEAYNVLWDIDKNYIYYTPDNNNLLRKSLITNAPTEIVLKLQNNTINKVTTNNFSQESSIYLIVRDFKENHLLDLSLKPIQSSVL